MSSVPWEFRDLCTTEGLSRSRKVAPDLPWDDPLWRYKAPSVASAGVCEQLQRDALLQTLAPCDQLRKVAHIAPEPMFATPKAADALVKLASRIEHIKKNASMHKSKIAGMLAEFKAAIGGRGSAEAWSRVEKSCLDCLHAQILADTA